MNGALTAARLQNRTRYPVELITLFIVTGLAMVGTLIAIDTFTAAHHEALPHSASIGEPIATSFGSITIARVETLGGLTSQELGGMTHGIQNVVLSDGAQVEVSVLLANRSDGTVRVTPSQFYLTVEGATEPALPSESSIKPVTLRAGASVEATLTFVVPQSGARMSVGYADPGGARITVPAGKLGQAPIVADDGHGHEDGQAHDDDGHTHDDDGHTH